MLKTARSHGKDPYDKKKEQREGGKKNSAGSKNAKLPLWSTQDEQNHDRTYQLPMSTKGTGSL